MASSGGDNGDSQFLAPSGRCIPDDWGEKDMMMMRYGNSGMDTEFSRGRMVDEKFVYVSVYMYIVCKYVALDCASRGA